MNKFVVIYEKTGTGFSSYSPELPGCIAIGKTIEETKINMKEAIEFHIEGMTIEGLEIPNSEAIYTQFLELELN